MTSKITIAVGILILITLTYFLSLVFSGRLILPQTFHIGPATIHYYGLIMSLAVAGAFFLAWKQKDKYQISEKQAEDLLFWAILGGFVGARLYHVLSMIGYYYAYPVDIIKVWNGGLSIFGAVLGGIIIILIFALVGNGSPRFRSGEAGRLEQGRNGDRPLQWILNRLDWLAPSVALGQIIGRFGNLFNYEAFGYPTNLPWKMFVPENYRPAGFTSFGYFHPWFLYEALGSVIILLFLLNNSKQRPSGRLFFFYLLLYNVLRFVLEFLRIDSTFFGVIRLNTISSLVLALVSVFCLLKIPRDAKISS